MYENSQRFSQGKEGEIMANYLYSKYKNKFRVKADYDLSTNDFPRDELGNIDSSFDDFYIPCASKGKIRHYEQNILLYYCTSIGRFRNILKQIYEDKVGSLEKFKTYNKPNKEGKVTHVFDIESMYSELIDKGIIFYICEYEEEGEFRFKADLMDYIASLVKPSTSGSSISPLSIKNLPSKKYDIPKEELDKYKEITKNIDKSNAIILSQLVKKFDDIIQKKKGKDYDIKYERRLSCLKGKEFIHSIGLFDDYLIFLKENLEK
jgi:hypothetical protein